jgi:hypothetical protein
VESEGPSAGKGGECDVVSRHLQGCSPRVCQLWTNGLAPLASIERIDHMLVIWAH